jgi:hypothetical protein
MIIEERRWSEYLDELSRRAAGYAAAVEILSEELGDQTEVRRAALRELTFEPREGIAISIGERAELLRHVIAAPVRLEATDEPGVPSALRITDDAGTQTLVRLAAP